MKPERVVFIPGTMCDQHLWDDIRPLLGDVEWDHLAIPDAGDIDGVVHQIAHLIEPDNVPVLGFSLGGYLAAALAVAYPHKVSKLLVCSNSPCALPAKEIAQREQLLMQIDRLGYAGLSHLKIKHMLAPQNVLNHRIADRMRAMDAALGVNVLTSQLKATTQRRDLQKPLAHCKIPMVFCYGTDDALVDPIWFKHLQQVNDQAQVHEIPGAGHMLPLEQPALLAEQILNWLA